MLNITGAEARQRALVESIRFRIRFELVFERRAVPLLDRQARAAARVYEDSNGDMIATMAAVESFGSQWGQLFQGHYGKVGQETGKKYYDDLKGERIHIETKDFESFYLDYMRFVGFLGAQKVQQVEQTTKNIIKEAVAIAKNLGLSTYDIAKDIYGKVSGIGRLTAKVRCRLIARTETHFAYNYANQKAGENSELDLEKEWLAAEDEATREDHAAVDGDRVNLNESFSVGGTLMMYPGAYGAPPEQVCNCRCSTLQHVKNPKKTFPGIAIPVLR